MTKNPLEQQKNELIKEYNYHRVTGKERDPLTFWKLLLAVALLCLVNAPSLYAVPEQQQAARHHAPKKWPMPDTWRCSKCGYENYDGISYCALCGGR